MPLTAYKFCNDYQGKLTSDMTAGQLTLAHSLPITDSTGAGITGLVMLRIDDELMVASVSSGTITAVARGAETTTAVSHLAAYTDPITGVLGQRPIRLVVTAGQLAELFGNSSAGPSISIGTYASRPSSGAAVGDTYHFTDSYCAYSHAVWNGTSWDHFSPYFGRIPAAHVPVLADWTLNNCNGTTRLIDASRGGLWFQQTSNAASNQSCYRAKPANNPWVARILAKVWAHPNESTSTMGFGFRRSSDGRYKVGQVITAGNWPNMGGGEVVTWASSGSFDAFHNGSINLGASNGVVALEILDPGATGTRRWWAGPWADTLRQLRSENVTDFGVCSHVQIGMAAQSITPSDTWDNTGHRMVMHVVSYEVRLGA